MGTKEFAKAVVLLRPPPKPGFDFIKIESLCAFDGQKGYSGAD